MKATGIIRRIDDLGRVVIPKDIRRQMGVQEGDPLELFVEGRRVAFEKYYPLGLYTELARDYVRSFQETTQRHVFITDTDKVVASVLHNFFESPLSAELKEAIRSKTDAQGIPLNETVPSAVVEYAAIIRDGSRTGLGDGIGAVVLVQDGAPLDDSVKVQMRIAADFLGRLASAGTGY